MTTDTTERGLERLICTALTGSPCDAGAEAPDSVHERPAVYGAGWICGASEDYDREYCVDLVQLSAFSECDAAQTAEALELDEDGPTRRKFLARLQGEITKRGTIDVLRNGVKHGAHDVDLFYGTPSPGNVKAGSASEPLQRDPPAPLQPRRDPAGARPGLFINGCRWPPSS
jgi:type I restriction enzyme R subunit